MRVPSIHEPEKRIGQQEDAGSTPNRHRTLAHTVGDPREDQNSRGLGSASQQEPDKSYIPRYTELADDV